jgi:hypothetical protein
MFSVLAKSEKAEKAEYVSLQFIFVLKCDRTSFFFTATCNDVVNGLVWIALVLDVRMQWNDTDRMNKSTRRKKPVTVPLCPPQVSHGLARD